MEQLMHNIANRQYLKFREMLKKTLVEKYFPFEGQNYLDIEKVTYESIRGKTIRKLFFLFKKFMRSEKKNAQICGDIQ